MALDFNGKTIETDANGYLVDANDWSEELAAVLAKEEGIEELTQQHWDLINYLREEYFNNGGHQPNNREINKHLASLWGKKIGSKDVFALFPLGPSKQAGKIAGLPESRRKGGY
jgi:tRNA 2-thiouridine synthesizing protein E